MPIPSLPKRRSTRRRALCSCRPKPSDCLTRVGCVQTELFRLKDVASSVNPPVSMSTEHLSLEPRNQRTKEKRSYKIDQKIKF